MKTPTLLVFCLVSLGTTTFAAPKETAARESFPAVSDLGNVMYIGDGITHGVAGRSYRWQLFKIWADNGITQKEVGVHQGNYSHRQRRDSPPQLPQYGKTSFLNVHSAMAAERAYEVSGRDNSSDRLEGSNIFDWLGLDQEYPGYRRIDPATQNPASYFLMIGLGDMLLDAGKDGIGSCIAETQKNLLGKGGDMDTIIRAMRQANPHARIAVMTIPTWAPECLNNGRPADYAAIRQYNARLKDWGKARKVAIIEVNRGLVDESTGSFCGCGDLFNADKLHLNPQGELIIAGNIARQLGYAGRTAGLKRWPGKEFPLHMAELAADSEAATISKKGVLNLKGNLSHMLPEHKPTSGSTLELHLAKKGYGNGAKGGWSKNNPLRVTLMTPAGSGCLSVNESSIRWGEGWGRTLYSGDMSKIGGLGLRICYTEGCPAQGVPGGFYVWLGDMLIGEGLHGGASHGTGFEISGGNGVSLSRLDYDPEKAWAPETRAFTNGNPLIADKTPDEAKKTPNTASKNESPQAEHTGVAPRGGFRLCSGSIAGNVHTSLGKQDSAYIRQDVSTPNTLCQGELGGSANLAITPEYTGTQPWLPFIASMNCKGIRGDATIEVKAANFRVQGASFWGQNCSLIGTYKSTIAGKISFLLHQGQYEGSIYGGAIGKGEEGTIGSITIELGNVDIQGNVYGGGSSGIVQGDTAITLHGAAKVKGETICTGGHIGLRGADGGKIQGGSTLTLCNAAPGAAMASYRGTLSGGRNVEGPRKLVLDNVTLGTLRASLADFDEIHIVNGSVLTLESLGGASKLVVEAGSRLTLTGEGLEASIHNEGHIELEKGCTLRLLEPGSEGSGTGRYSVKTGATLSTGNLKPDNDIRRGE